MLLPLLSSRGRGICLAITLLQRSLRPGTLGTHARRFPRAAERVLGLEHALRAQGVGLGPYPSQRTSPWPSRWEWCRSIGYGMKGLRFVHPLRGRRLVTVCNSEHGSGRLHLIPDTYGQGGQGYLANKVSW